MVNNASELPQFTQHQLFEWLLEEQPAAPVVDLVDERAHEVYLTMHPRIVWLKNLPLNSVLLDVGAGSGHMVNFRESIGFPRTDISFLGVSLSHGEYTEKYDEFHQCDLEAEKPAFSRQPTAVLLCHVIEHIRDLEGLMTWINSLIPRGARIYIEWPGPNTLRLPSNKAFWEKGYHITTLNFYDDSSHVKAYDPQYVISLLARQGITTIAQGYVDMPLLANSLKFIGLQQQPQEYMLSMAFWLKTLFSTYLVGIKL